MCGRFSLGFPVPIVADEFQVQEVEFTYQPRYNIAPTQNVAAVLQKPLTGTDEAGDHPDVAGTITTLTGLRWGLVPSWARDPALPGAKLINARSETAARKPAFRAAFRSRRCLIPASGFYEWQRTRGGKQPYHIQLKGGGRPMGLAGLWESWTPSGGGGMGRSNPGSDREHGPAGENEGSGRNDSLGQEGSVLRSALRTCTILTTTANELMAPLHDRMPVIITDREDRALWLDHEVKDREALEPLLQPYPAEKMEAWAVSKRVNSVAEQGQGLTKRLEGLGDYQ